MHARPRFQRAASFICCTLLLAACGGDGPTGPPRNQPSVRAVLGAGVVDTIDAQPLQALVVEVRGQGGELTSGTIVRFESQPPADTMRRYDAAVYVCSLAAPTCGSGGYYGGFYGGGASGDQFATDTTDAQGRAKVTVRLGHVAGRAVVRLEVPEFGLADSATFTVMPGAGVRVLASPADTSLEIGAKATLRGKVVDRYDNARPEVPTITAGPGSAITLDATTGTVTARDMGTQWLFSRYTSFVDSMSVHVVPSGRLVVWAAYEQAVRLVNLSGSSERTIVSNVQSDLGVFPRFDATRHHITLHAGSEFYGGAPNTIVVIDTTGSPRRDIGPAIGFSMVIATRQLADGTVLVVGQSSTDTSHPGYSLWRVATDNTITFLVALPDLQSTYDGADISHNGARVAYVATTPSYTIELRVLDVSNGSTTLLAANALSPRWSSQDDRVAYLVPGSGSSGYDGVLVVSNADGSGRRGIGNDTFSPGIAWSPDGTYIIGRSSASGLRLMRVSDGANVLLRFNSATGSHDYFQPDWR